MAPSQLKEVVILDWVYVDPKREVIQKRNINNKCRNQILCNAVNRDTEVMLMSYFEFNFVKS